MILKWTSVNHWLSDIESNLFRTTRIRTSEVSKNVEFHKFYKRDEALSCFGNSPRTFIFHRILCRSSPFEVERLL